MRSKCPCGTELKFSGNRNPNSAALLPDVRTEEFFDAVVKSAMASHDASIAIQDVLFAASDFFRAMCQCPSCGRVFVEDDQFQDHEFVPASASAPKDLLSKAGPTSTPGSIHG